MAYVDLLSRLEDIQDAIDEAERFTVGMCFEELSQKSACTPRC
jgi:hypothetical protein